MAIAAPVSLMQFLLVATVVLRADLRLCRLRLLGRSTSSRIRISQKPLIYKISGVWGNHEGSMLLWVLILALFGALVALSRQAHARRPRAPPRCRSRRGSLGAFLLFILLTSNPFARVGVPPIEGRDLNPLLQDPGLAIHPPLLYLGYVGFSITFSFAAAALIDGRIDAAWARWVRPWTLIAWMFLTLGIAMGSYWAYYTLGWGGFWFWDPVENASLMPWLAGTALLHSRARHGKARRAEGLDDPARDPRLLAVAARHLPRALGRADLGAFLRQRSRSAACSSSPSSCSSSAARSRCSRSARRSLKQGGIFAPISREGALVLNNLLLTDQLRHRARRHALSAGAGGR